MWSECCSQPSLPTAAKPLFSLPATLSIQMRPDPLPNFYLRLDMEYIGFCSQHCSTFGFLSHVEARRWQDLLTHLTLHDCESLLSFWNQDGWACRHSALVIMSSLSRPRPRNTDRALSLSLAVNRRTNEFWEKQKKESSTLGLFDFPCCSSGVRGRLFFCFCLFFGKVSITLAASDTIRWHCFAPDSHSF